VHPWHNKTSTEQNPAAADGLSLLKRYPAVYSYVAKNVKMCLNLHKAQVSILIRKVKQYMWSPLGLQEIETPRVSGQKAYERGEVVSLRHRPPLPPGDKLGYNFF